MKLWHGMFIFTFIILYGTLGFGLLGRWAYERAKSCRDARYLPIREKHEPGA
jgi:hypothetical protein